jgi:KAP family P-loop domain
VSPVFFFAKGAKKGWATRHAQWVYNPAHMNVPTSSGYDAAKARREEDDLDRWRFAAEIVDVVIATPQDWSARIGIFGKWGEGKSTVLRFAEQMLKERGSIVFSFSPWAIQNWNDLWEDFGSRLMEALLEAGVPFDGSWKKSAKEAGRWLEGKGISRLAETAAGYWGKDKLYNAAFGALGRWLSYDGPQIRSIREKLRDKRLVVLVDDLDRCSPELIPRLLLSLRELLDLPGFSFLLAFDDEIVGRALAAENPAWQQGSNFLEKILDFRFHLPPITQLQKQRFVLRALSKYCDFVPVESAKEIQDLLPNNPRKLKSLIRSFAAFEPQVGRHDSDELNWVDMWLAMMLRLESYPFFERLLVGTTLEDEGTFYEVRARFSRRMGTDNEKESDKNEGIARLVRDAGVNNPVTEERLIRLVKAIRARASFKFRYMSEMTLRPHAVTWKEFRLLFAAWVDDRRASVLSNWISLHAKSRAVSVEDVEVEVFEAIASKRNELLSAAAESGLSEEQEFRSLEAGVLLEMAEQYLLGLGKLDAVRFNRLYDQILYWIGFRANPSDEVLRAKEETFLLTILLSAPAELSIELLEVLKPEAPTWEIGDGQSWIR